MGMGTGMRTGSGSRADILVFGFGTTVAMWAVGYVCRLPGVLAPGWLPGPLLLLCLLAGGFAAGRYGQRGWLGGAQAGLLAGVLNLLILGSVLAGDEPNQLVPSALLWIPGSLLASMVIAAAGAVLGRRAPHRWINPPNWRASFVTVAIVATLLLLAVGGAVTGYEAGLAVPDWPNSYGYNMCLYPLSKMTGGIYYEHAHRLFGSLVGLTTLVLAVYTHVVDKRRWVRGVAWLAVVAVVAQGVLGGLRVTGRFTLSTSPEALAPSLALAVIHGIFAQVFLCLLVALRASVATTWQSDRQPKAAQSAGADFALGAALPILILIQLALGALLRHITWGLILHIAMAVIVTVAAIAVGIRAWGLYREFPVLPRLGTALLVLIGGQITLGMIALVAIGGTISAGEPTGVQVAITTVHQTVGALLLACSVKLLFWYHRLLKNAVEPSGLPVSCGP